MSDRFAWRSWLVALVLAAPGTGDEVFKQGDWPFQPLRRPELPESVSAASPVDRFIVAKLNQLDLQLSPQADKRALLRRVTFSLTGLLPTKADMDAFLADNAPDAYEKVVDRLLASPRYGEHWAKSWLDLVRYAESAGYKIDELRPEAWRYRDYVIKAYNTDLPYNRFLQQQLAGDEIEPDNPDAVVATGFNRLYIEESNASNFVLARQEILNDVTEVAGFVFLGLTLSCARCHDHKFDPIEQEDFYRLQAVFAGLLPRNDVPAVEVTEKQKYQAGMARWESATAPVRQQIDSLIQSTKIKAMQDVTEAFDAQTRSAVLKPMEMRSPMEKQLAALSSRTVTKKMNRVPTYLTGDAKTKYGELAKSLEAHQNLKPAELPLAMSVTDVGKEAPTTFLLDGGNYQKAKTPVEPGVPEFLGEDDLDIHPLASNSQTTGRRASLAEWLTRPDHPLVTRVYINRVWQQYFGVGIVPTSSDFGVMREEVTHPELLDWLAAELVANGFRLKPIHKLIVMSETYRQSSTLDERNLSHQHAQTTDPSNHFLWRFRRHRLTGEAIRDVSLQLSGRLNPKMYGPSGRPQLPEELLTNRYAWVADPLLEDQDRRTIYTFTRRNLRLPIVGAFDAPDLITSCSRRTSTVTAPQALTMLNGKFGIDQAQSWSTALLLKHGPKAQELIADAYHQAFGRAPQAEELREAERFIHEQAERIAEDVQEIDTDALPRHWPNEMLAAQAAATVDFCHALLNASELLFLD